MSEIGELRGKTVLLHLDGRTGRHHTHSGCAHGTGGRALEEAEYPLRELPGLRTCNGCAHPLRDLAEALEDVEDDPTPTILEVQHHDAGPRRSTLPGTNAAEDLVWDAVTKHPTRLVRGCCQDVDVTHAIVLCPRGLALWAERLREPGEPSEGRYQEHGNGDERLHRLSAALWEGGLGTRTASEHCEYAVLTARVLAGAPEEQGDVALRIWLDSLRGGRHLRLQEALDLSELLLQHQGVPGGRAHKVVDETPNERRRT